MQTFSRGQKGKLQDLGLSQSFHLEICLAHQNMNLDAACFGLDAAGKLSDDRFMIFFNQLQSPQAAITLHSETRGAQLFARFALLLDALPSSIEKLVFVASIDGQGTMQALHASKLSLLQAGNAALEFCFNGSDFQQEKAVILAEIYRRDGVWRFAAVGQGFNGGLSALLAHFGGSEITTQAPSPSPAPAPAPAPATTPATTPAPSAPAESKKISLSKVTLEKRGDKVSLEKQSGQQFGRMHVNLNWARKEKKPGLFGRFFSPSEDVEDIDLDLGCLFQMADGRPGAVQALGNAWGNFEQAPFIKLDTDDRSGVSKEGENLYINGKYFDQIKRVLIYAFIYEGAGNWQQTNGVVTLHIPDQPPIEVRLDQGRSEIMCAIAMLENQQGKLQVTKLVEYFSGQGKITAHQQMDERYGFGLRWGVGSKD